MFITSLIINFCVKNPRQKHSAVWLFYLPFCAMNLVFFSEKAIKMMVLALSLSCLFFAITSVVKPNYKPIISAPKEQPKEQPKNLNLTEKLLDFSVEKLVKKQQTNVENVKSVTDFTHVKNVIERLNSFPLTVGDKKQIKELEDAIIMIENGLEDEYSLGDELGALLKIMAKYGV